MAGHLPLFYRSARRAGADDGSTSGTGDGGSQGRRWWPLGRGRRGSGEGDCCLRDGDDGAPGDGGVGEDAVGTTASGMRRRECDGDGDGGEEAAGSSASGGVSVQRALGKFFLSVRGRASSNYIGEGFHCRLNLRTGTESCVRLPVVILSRQ